MTLGCSALRQQYREVIISADPNYGLRIYASMGKFICDADLEVHAAHLEKIIAEGKHFMPTTLLQSQIDLLQIDDCDRIF
ncbi:hypothetical protein FEM48_Zijuj03G0195700 [Ziziphus jujuba var. spinosa]|uniref:gluconokinase n=1 Tax=Ziziphus jujuba var. spinosa TaxID=714518 RepID=A0A978VS77_ZIZJJ|nr:hypothetical protein FEM48_Zijuj03G0195700 [Ziziphus jujuba var. spinosa]